MPTAIAEAGAGVVSLATHEEFEQRMNDNIRMQNEQIQEIKGRLNDTHEMVASVASLATAMENMASEQGRQGNDIREIRAKVESINVEHIEIKLEEHDRKFDDHDRRLREQELKPQDSDDHECRLREVERKAENSADHEKRLRTLEGKDGKNWEKLIAAIIAGVAAFLVGLACRNMWG